jgi:RND family efflux transporter MFP subunit
MNERIYQVWSASRIRWTLSVVSSVVLVVLLLTIKHGRATTTAETVPGATAAPSVAVVKVTCEDLAREVRIPAEFRPYAEVELHAKVSGYLHDIKVDFGDRVKAGQLLATIEVPELQNELDNAVATQQKAEADHKNAHLVYSRLLAVNQEHPNLVAQQDLDAAESRDNDTAAATAAAKADVEKFQTMLAYTKITAPFDGVITHRYTDPGSMIQAGTASQAVPLVRISDNYRLRLDFPVSVDAVKNIKEGDPVDVSVDSIGNKTFTRKITRYSRRVDDATRTMTVEMEVPNPNLELVPGMYATVILKVDRRKNAVALPAEALPPGRNSVYVVNSNNEVEERSLSLGIETPTKNEVLSGLKAGDLVIIGNSAGIRPGQKVAPKLVSQLAEQ